MQKVEQKIIIPRVGEGPIDLQNAHIYLSHGLLLWEEDYIEIYDLKLMFIKKVRVDLLNYMVLLSSNGHKVIHRNANQTLTIKELTEIVNCNS